MLPSGYLILGAILLLPLTIGLAFRVSTSHLFFSLLAGELLARTFGDDATLIIGAFGPRGVQREYVELAILMLPIILTALFLRKTLSRGKALLHVLPLAATGIVFAAFILPISPEAILEPVKHVEAGRLLLDSSGMIVGVVVFLQLITLWLLNRERGGKRKR